MHVCSSINEHNKTRIPKDTFSDPTGLNPNTNPVRLDGKGEANIYWASDELYSIELYDVNGNLILSQDDYSAVFDMLIVANGEKKATFKQKVIQHPIMII